MQSPLLFFVNLKSGGNLGQSLIDAVINMDEIYIVKLPDDAKSWAQKFESILHRNDLKVVVCGGDGSVNWAVSLLTEVYGSDFEDGKYRPPISVVPLGTGNDMSRMLGWGASFTSSDVSHIRKNIDLIRNSDEAKNLDMWSISYVRSDDESQKFSKVMLNYCSFGVDANIANTFQSCRTNCASCFCCHCMSKCLYFPCSFKSFCGQPSLKKVLKCKYYNGDENEKTIDFKNSEKTFIVQAITSIYSGKDLWRNKIPRSIDDKKFEIITHGGALSLGLNQIGLHPEHEKDQASKMSLETSEPIAFQIDGEPYIINGPAKIDIERIGSYPMLFCKK